LEHRPRPDRKHHRRPHLTGPKLLIPSLPNQSSICLSIQCALPLFRCADTIIIIHGFSRPPPPSPAVETTPRNGHSRSSNGNPRLDPLSTCPRGVLIHSSPLRPVINSPPPRPP
jgi:hypothetical protein